MVAWGPPKQKNAVVVHHNRLSLHIPNLKDLRRQRRWKVRLPKFE